ncbi:hypothetical protein ABN362_22330 [Providencia alcalifaciens]|uniref:hypothetical protein n=1 Tax=Providencia alcalifaciens TaxID=126385 RepID=UPI0032DBCF4B
MKLPEKKFNDNEAPKNEARFINKAKETVTQEKKGMYFHLDQQFHEIIDSHATMGFAKADVVRAALLALDDMDENTVMSWKIKAMQLK